MKPAVQSRNSRAKPTSGQAPKDTPRSAKSQAASHKAKAQRGQSPIAKSDKPQARRAELSWSVVKSSGLHQRNAHQGRYDFTRLINALPALQAHVVKTPNGDASIDFANPSSVLMLNKALLSAYYAVHEWQIPQGFLCPPIPGRADYVHRLAQLLSSECKTLNHHRVTALDVGVGANCIYPIVAATSYGWRCVGSDIDPISVNNAQQIANANPVLKNQIECRLQPSAQSIFRHVIAPNERYDVTLCNPPFHSSLAQAAQGSARKQKNLAAHKTKRGASAMATPALNFGGQKAELWCPGGEAAFIKSMAIESRLFAEQVLWFSTLISKKDNVRWLRKQLESVGALQAKVVEMQQGQKVSRFVAWTFKNAAERQEWLQRKC